MRLFSCQAVQIQIGGIHSKWAGDRFLNLAKPLLRVAPADLYGDHDISAAVLGSSFATGRVKVRREMFQEVIAFLIVIGDLLQSIRFRSK